MALGLSFHIEQMNPLVETREPACGVFWSLDPQEGEVAKALEALINNSPTRIALINEADKRLDLLSNTSLRLSREALEKELNAQPKSPASKSNKFFVLDSVDVPMMRDLYSAKKNP